VNSGARNTAFAEILRHEIGVAVRAAESQGSLAGVFSVLVENVGGACLRGDGVGEGLLVEAATPPRDAGVVDLIGNTDVVKWCEALALDAFEEMRFADGAWVVTVVVNFECVGWKR